jgi:hypothetical protein
VSAPGPALLAGVDIGSTWTQAALSSGCAGSWGRRPRSARTAPPCGVGLVVLSGDAAAAGLLGGLLTR